MLGLLYKCNKFSILCSAQTKTQMKRPILKYVLLLYFWMAYMLPLSAYPNDPDANENEAEQQTSIDNWEFVLIIAAITTGTCFAASSFRRQSGYVFPDDKRE